MTTFAEDSKLVLDALLSLLAMREVNALELLDVKGIDFDKDLDISQKLRVLTTVSLGNLQCEKEVFENGESDLVIMPVPDSMGSPEKNVLITKLASLLRGDPIEHPSFNAVQFMAEQRDVRSAVSEVCRATLARWGETWEDDDNLPPASFSTAPGFEAVNAVLMDGEEE